MEAIIAIPKNVEEFKLLKELLRKMRIASAVLTDEEKEELGLLKLMNEADRAKKVSKQVIMAKLKHK